MHHDVDAQPSKLLKIDLGRVVDISKVIAYPYTWKNRGRLANVSILITESNDVPGSLDQSKTARRLERQILRGTVPSDTETNLRWNANGAPCNVVQ